MSWSEDIADEIKELFEEPTIKLLLLAEGKARDWRSSRNRISWPGLAAQAVSEAERKRKRSILGKAERKEHRAFRRANAPPWSPPAPSPRPDLEAKRARQRALIALSRTGQSVIE